MLDPDEHIRRPLSTAKEEEGEYHFRSLDDILGYSERDQEDRVVQLAGRLARDVLASSIVFAEHQPLRITASVTSWTSVGSQTETHFHWIGGVAALASQPSLLNKRREQSRSIPALLDVPPPPSLITPSSSAHADLARNSSQGANLTGTNLAIGGGSDHTQARNMTNGTGVSVPRVRNGGVPVNESVTSRQAVTSIAAAQLPVERNVASTLSPRAEDSFSSELPKVNPRSVSLPNHQRTKQKEGLAPRRSSSFRGGGESLKSARDRRWSYDTGDFAPATPSFVVDQRVALGARYASEKSLHVAEVSPTPFQLLQSQMNAEGSFPLPISAAMQQRGKGSSTKRGERAGRRPTTAAEHARAWKSSGRGSKKSNAFSRLWQRLFRHNRSSAHDPGRKPVGEWPSRDQEDSSGRISFPPVRTHPGKIQSASNSRRAHQGVTGQLSRISSVSCPSIGVTSAELATDNNELSSSPSTGHEEVEVIGSRTHHLEETGEESSVKPRRANSLRISVRRGMNRIRGLSVRRRNKKQRGESGGDRAGGGHGSDGDAPFRNGERGGLAVDSASDGGGVMEIVSIGSSTSSQSLDDGGGGATYHGGVYMGDNVQHSGVAASRHAGKSGYPVPSVRVDTTGDGHHGGGPESPTDHPPGDWRSLAAHGVPGINRSGSTPQVRINPPGERGDVEATAPQPAPTAQVAVRGLAPGKRALRAQRSKSVEGTTFDAAKHLTGFAGRPKGIPISPSCTASLERGYTLGAGDGFAYHDGAAQSGVVRRTSSQRAADPDANRLSIPGYQSSGPGMSMPPPSSESHSLSHSFSNLLNIVASVRRPSAQSSAISEATGRLSGSFLALPGARKNYEPQYLSTESLTHSCVAGAKDVEFGGLGSGGRLLDTSQMDAGISGSVPVSSLHPPNKSKHEMTNEDYRQHVVCTLLDMERSYVLSLQTLCKDYFNPLRRMNNIDQQIVADIFNDIPLITLHHNQLYYELKERADSWSDEETIGDIITNAFSFGQLAEAYSSYVVNYEHSQDTLRNTACQPLVKFIKSRNKENEGKQTLSDLLVKPVQRIPRYGLIIKDLLNYTPTDHPDHGLLMSAFADVEALADKLDRGVKHADQLDDLRKIELCFQGSLTGLVSPDRYLVRRDRISEQVAKSGHKERWLFLFNDRMVCAMMRRRTGNRKPMSMSISPGTLTDPDVVRYKLMWRAPLQDVCVLQTPRDKMLETQSAEILQRLQDDLNTLSQMNSLCNGLSTSRPGSAAVGNLQVSIGAVLREINMVIDEQKHDRDVATLQIAIESKTSGLIDHTIAFPTVKEKTDWIAAFSECKETVVAALGGASAWCTPDERADDTVQPVMRLPAFSAAMPVLKTRSGMQITCSSPSVGARQLTPYALDAKADGQLWICTSDGQVGQICMVSMEKSPPAVSACIAVPDGKITSILSVPEYVPPSVSDSLARIRRAEERDSSVVASDSEFETVSDAGTEGVADDDVSLKPNARGVSPRAADRPERRLSSEELAFVRSKLSTALLLSYRNRLRLPSMVMEEKEDSNSLFGERSRALSVLSNVSLKAFGDESLGSEELESIYSSASLLRVLSATPGLLTDDGLTDDEAAGGGGSVDAAADADGFDMAPVKRLLVQSLSDGALVIDPGALDAAAVAPHAPLARTKSHLPSSRDDLHGLPKMAELLRHLQHAHSQSLSQGQGPGVSTPLQSQLSHASLLSASSNLLEAPAKADGSNEWSQPEPTGEPLLQRKSLSDDDDDDDDDNEKNILAASGSGDQQLQPEGSMSDRDEPLEVPSMKPRHSVPISAKRLQPLVRRLSAPAESPTRLPLKSVKSPEDVFEVAGGKRLTNAVQNLLKPSRKGLVRKPALRATKSGSASSTDVESSPVRYLGHASSPVQTQAAASSSGTGTSGGTSQDGRKQQRREMAAKSSVSSVGSDVCRSGSNVSRHSIDVVRRHKGSLQCRSHRSRKNRSQSLPQVILSSHTSVSGSTTWASGPSSDSADREASPDHDPTMWLSMSNGQLCIYRAGDSIQMRQRKTVLKLSSDVKCMCYLDGCVFVSLEGGQLLQFCRSLSGNWETSSADLIDVGEAREVVSCMTVVAQQELWCGVGKSVHVVHPLHRQVQASFVVSKSTEASAQVTQMVCNDSAVYITTNTSPVVSVYHAHNHRLLAEVNIQPCVQYLLQGCDSIIKQHKTRCLRITVMHAYRSSVWIGTSAGIILAVPALHVAKETTDSAAATTPAGNNDIIQLQCHGSFHGHTGPVRFITTVEMPATRTSSQQGGGSAGNGAAAAVGSSAAASSSQGATDSTTDAHGAQTLTTAPPTPSLPPPSSLMSLVSNSMRSSMFLVDQNSIMHAKKPPPMVAAESYQPLADVEAMVVAGGDGCEDFHVSNMVENDENSFDNSGSHILMWQVD